MYDEIVYACAINKIFNYQCLIARRLIDLFPSPSSVFRLSASELDSLLCGHSEMTSRLQDNKLLESCAREVDWCHKYGIKIIFISDREYPTRLRECEDAPIILFQKGTSDLNPARAISIVGTRRATGYGTGQCREIVKYLSQVNPPPVIISGLAYGIDIAAHKAAIDFGLSTIAVLPTGLDNIYPAQHYQWAAKITENGSLITDFHKSTPSYPINFLQRNRIIAGIADAVLLIESDTKGGGMVTARTALSYSREVFAVPGRNTDRFSAGCNLLISNNEAAILPSAEELCFSLGWQKRKPRRKTVKEKLNCLKEEKNPLKRNILVTLCDNSDIDADKLMDSIDANATDILSALTELEMDGRIESDLYGKYKLIEK